MLELLNVDRFDEMYGIMEYSFPESERRSREGQRKLFADPRYKVAAQSDERGRLEAFLAYWQLEKVTFLEHFAVAADLRGAGLGGRFLDELLTALKKPVLLEAEPPETDIAARRIAFYERHGFVLNGYDYIQPPLGEGRDSIPLKVMTYGEGLTPESFNAIRAEIYAAVYKLKI